MIFSSIEFIYLFLPLTMIGFLYFRIRGSETGIILWLIATSFVFYGAWHPPFLLLMMASLAINWWFHLMISRYRDPLLLGTGIILNLGTIAYFKYANLFVDTANALFGTSWLMSDIMLPLAISFFTFQQIAFLVETYRGQVVDTDLKRYVLFIVFFPQLIAGPIVLQRHTVPQFRLSVFSDRFSLNLAIGLTLFIIGLFKKIVLADSMALYATPVFHAADAGASVPFFMAWSGALAYTFQIYFDFSGYCDMALGLARMFGIRLPVNFNSPYKATSIIDFWRRWHITLSLFLRDYLYIPLGGNRNGPSRRNVNLIITMLLGGLWHGAGWTFVFWGGLHGAYLMINHWWNAVAGKPTTDRPTVSSRIVGGALTFCAVIVAWVFFRSTSFSGAVGILSGMSGLEGFELPSDAPAALSMISDGVATSYLWFLALAAVVWFCPNSIEITSRYRPALDFRQALGSFSDQCRKHHRLLLLWRPTARWSGVFGVAGVIALVQLYRIGDLSEFIYFNF